MTRIVVIGNSGGGKSTLARRLAECRSLPYFDIDRLVWRQGWQLAPVELYEAEHTELIGRDTWLIDGLGHQDSIPARMARATEAILIDLPLWVHFWLAAERQIAWSKQGLSHPPAGIKEMPPTRELFRTIWDIDQTWMPGIRSLCLYAEREGKRVVRLTSIDELDGFPSRGLADSQEALTFLKYRIRYSIGGGGDGYHQGHPADDDVSQSFG